MFDFFFFFFFFFFPFFSFFFFLLSFYFFFCLHVHQQRVFLSHNNISSYEHIGCVFRCTRTLSELALSENPIVNTVNRGGEEGEEGGGGGEEGGGEEGEEGGGGGEGDEQLLLSQQQTNYKSKVLAALPNLTHLDLSRVTDEDRREAKKIADFKEDV